MSRTYDQQCPIACTLDLIGDRWTLLILRDLFFERTTFTELIAHSPGMPTKILSDRLKALEATGLIVRTIYSTHPLRADYHLTDQGRSLAPVMEAIVNWGMEYAVRPDARLGIRKRIREDVRRVAGGAKAMGWRSAWVYQRDPARTKRRPRQ